MSIPQHGILSRHIVVIHILAITYDQSGVLAICNGLGFFGVCVFPGCIERKHDRRFTLCALGLVPRSTFFLGLVESAKKSGRGYSVSFVAAAVSCVGMGTLLLKNHIILRHSYNNNKISQVYGTRTSGRTSLGGPGWSASPKRTPAYPVPPCFIASSISIFRI